MILNKEMYTVSVLFIQYAFPLTSIVFAYSRIAQKMGTRFTPSSSNARGSNLIPKTDSKSVSSTNNKNNLNDNSELYKINTEIENKNIIINNNKIINQNFTKNIKFVNSNNSINLLSDQNQRNKLI